MYVRSRLCAAILVASVLIPGAGFNGAAGAATGTQPSPGASSIGDPYYPTLGNGGYRAQHYNLDLSVDVGRNTIASTVTMDARATQDLTHLSLDFVGFQIGAVTV